MNQINANQVNRQRVDDEIELKELILSIWKRKTMILSIVIVFTLLAGIYTFFLATPIYNTKLSIIISMPEEYESRYGEYKLPLTANDQYIQLFTSNDVLIKTINDLSLDNDMSIEDLRENISIKNSLNNANSNTFEIVVSYKNPSDSLKIANTLYINYKNFLDIMIKEQVVNHFYDNFAIELINLENKLILEQQTLADNQELLSQTTKELGINDSSIGIVDQLGAEGSYIVPVHTINPNYIKLESDIIGNKQIINTLSNTINMNRKYIVELEKEKQAIEKFYETGKTDTLNINLVSIVESNIYMPSLPVEASRKAGPSTIVNVAIGTILGGMLGVIIALFQWYWHKE